MVQNVWPIYAKKLVTPLADFHNRDKMGFEIKESKITGLEEGKIHRTGGNLVD